MQRRIRADKGRIEFPDGTYVEGEGLEVEEWPFNPKEGPRRWHIFGFSLTELAQKLDLLPQATITLYHTNGEVFQHLINVSLYSQLAAGGEDSLMGEEEPFQF